MEITWTEQSRFLIVQIDGEIDHHSADTIRAAVDKAYERTNAKHIIFDMARVGFMDSSGVGLLIGRYRAAEGMGGKVYAVGMREPLRRLFDLAGLTKIIKCHDTAADAMTEGGARHA